HLSRGWAVIGIPSSHGDQQPSVFPRVMISLNNEGQEMIPAAVQRLAWCCCVVLLAVNSTVADSTGSLATNQPGVVSRPQFRVLVLAESGGHHVAFTEVARPWLRKFGE